MSDVIEAEDSRDPANRSPGSEKVPGGQTARMTRFYRHQAALFDWTRGPVLLGRGPWKDLLHPGETVVEVGCGTGQNLGAMARAVGATGRVIGIECAPTMARRAARRARRAQRAGDRAEVLVAEYGRHHDLAAVRGADAFVFSYSLSMMPEFEAILDQVHDDLGPGGRLIVVDFAACRIAPLRRWMERCHVALGPARVDAVRARFEDVTLETRRAHAGLWEYYRLVARKPAVVVGSASN